MDTDLWGVLVRDIVVLADPHQIALMFRTLRTILFLYRVCRSEAKEAILLLGGELDTDRTLTLARIALDAENMLASEPDAEHMHVHPKIVANILREGSWAPDELTRQLWAGLLASSCSVDTPDDSNQIFVRLLIHITPSMAKILVHGCERTLGAAPNVENPIPGSVVLNPKEIIEVTAVYDLYRNATDLAYLFNLGLIQKVFDFTSYHDADSFDITPTNLGIELYKHCHGCREKLDPHLAEQAGVHLLNFLDQPHPSAFDDQAVKFTE